MTATATPEVRVTVRMYRMAVGDCFLLGFRQGREQRWMLIDCGTLLKGGGEPMARRVAADIAAVTRDEESPDGHLHLVVATHSHWDHISGFVEAEDLFREMRIDEVWLPSTEDPGHEGTAPRKESRSRLVAGLSRLAGDGAGEGGESGRLRGVAGLLGLLGECRHGGAGTGGPRHAGDGGLQLLRELAESRVRYLDSREPPQPLMGLSGVRAFVLGPAPERSGAGAAVAGLGWTLASHESAPDLRESFLAAARHAVPPAEAGEGPAFDDADDGMEALLERSQPFDVSHRLPVPAEDARKLTTDDRFFRRWYQGAQHQWRRIDHDWLTMARGIAVAVDHEINESSLALALELTGTGKVLLFPGDAQLGQWRSWQSLHWKVVDGEISRRVTAADLLRRTAVYKAAHHCGQGGTPLAQGLDLMERGDLVVLLPVGADAARELGWALPYPPLMERLRRKTRGRLLISGPPVTPLPEDPPEALGQAEWSAFRKSVSDGPLFVEYRLVG